jgi:hypothetical protein
MKLSITPAEVRGYSLSLTSPSIIWVLGWTKIFLGCGGVRILLELWYKISKTYKFLLQHNIADLPFPASNWLRQLVVELLGTWTISRALEDLQFNKQFANDVLPLGENLCSVHLMNIISITADWTVAYSTHLNVKIL